MQRLAPIAIAAVSLAFAGSAHAATLISAAVTGPTGTVWNTTSDSYYTLFLGPNVGPSSPVVNPNDTAINVPVTNTQGYLLYGEGFPGSVDNPAVPAPNSDSSYNLTLNFSNGATITGLYTPIGNIFSGGTSAVLDGALYTLTDFSWNRDRADVVQAFTATPGGDPNDYRGNFQLTRSPAAVPEPATWAMMLAGFGALGLAMRRKSEGESGAPRLRVDYA